MVMTMQLLLIFFGWLAHPFHVSVCDIEVNSEKQTLEISQRIFLDDLETALRKTPGWEALDVTKPADEALFNNLMKKYITDHIAINVNGQRVQLTYLGHEREADAMWCYIEATGVKNVNSIEVKNTILLETYDDQVNLVHIKNKGKIRSLKLYQDNASGAIEYD